jgi:2-succinyl-6-hydroxy-2,4-cyclohexadiene-1-carboxylate synthase
MTTYLARLNHYQFAYSWVGSPDLPIILFLHGFLGDRQEFDRAISGLSQQFCCLTVDLPGHGETEVMGADECYAMPHTAQGLIQFLDSLNIAQCFLVGYSMGGRLALYLALHFPQRFLKIVLESASPGLKTAAEQWQRQQSDRILAEELATGDLVSFLNKWYQNPLFATLRNHREFDNLLARRSQQRRNAHLLAKSLRYLSTGCQPSLWQQLPDNQIPLLLLVGESDRKFQAINIEMEKLCPAAQLKIVNRSGHNIHIEQAIAFAKNIQNFF